MDLKAEREPIETQYPFAEQMKVLLLRYTHRSAGELVDAISNYMQCYALFDAWIDLLLQTNTQTSPRNASKNFGAGGKEENKILEEFRHANRWFLNTEHTNNRNTTGGNSQLWYPIRRQNWSTKLMKTVHIVPQNLGYNRAE